MISRTIRSGFMYQNENPCAERRRIQKALDYLVKSVQSPVKPQRIWRKIT